MKKVSKILKSFFKDKLGATSIEYAVIALLVSNSIIISMTAIKVAGINSYGKISTAMANANGSSSGGSPSYS